MAVNTRQKQVPMMLIINGPLVYVLELADCSLATRRRVVSSAAGHLHIGFLAEFEAFTTVTQEYSPLVCNAV
jgi:hypothetical protein